MSQYRFVSAKEVLANTIRATGYKLPASYQDDILEWIPEGIGLLQVTRSMLKSSSGDENCPGEILIKNYVASLPCGFISMIRVEETGGAIVREASDTESLRKFNQPDARPPVFEVDPFTHPTSDGTTGTPSETPNILVNIQGGDLGRMNLKTADHYYEIKGNCIQTSFECGFIKIFYWAMPVCKEGYPLIPDNTNIKLALEWHVMKRLIGAGYEHKVFSYKDADQEFEKYAARGMGEVSYPTTDDMERAWRTNIRMIPPIGYADQFFILQNSTFY
jgi:hypothetical protein